jgi:peptide/nickel transport system permease protein
MTSYIVRRILQLVPILLFISAIVFFVFRIIPGDAVAVAMGEGADRESADALRHKLGLDKPVYLQYFDWLGSAVQGDLGTSLINHQSVLSLVLEKFPATLELTCLSVLLALLISLPVGILAALRRGSWIDQLTRVVTLAGFCMPRYWLAILLILFFAVQAHRLPPAGYVGLNEDPGLSLRYAALPVLSIALSVAAVQMRFLRSSLLDVISQDYIRTAYAKGLQTRIVILGHALKNTLIPFMTVVGLEFGNLLGGQVVVEQIFAWPGVGWLMIQSISQRDYAVVQGAVLLVACGFVILNLLVDVAYAYLDPRIRYV